MKIKKVLAVPTLSGFYFDDQKAIKGGARPDGFTYLGKARIEGFSSIRQPGEAISIILLLDDNPFNGDRGKQKKQETKYGGVENV